MPPDPGPAAGGGLGKRLLAMPAPRRRHGDEFIDLLDRQQGAECPAMSELAVRWPGRYHWRQGGVAATPARCQ
jgi:hypothetical protein